MEMEMHSPGLPGRLSDFRDVRSISPAASKSFITIETVDLSEPVISEISRCDMFGRWRIA